MQLPHNLASSIDRIARTALGKDWNLYASLIKHWSEIVGEEYAQNTTPVKMIFPKGKKTDEKWAAQKAGGSLTIRIPQGLAMEFTFISEQIKTRVNNFFGYNALERIILEPYYAEQKESKSPPLKLSAEQNEELEKNMEMIENNELRDALLKLGKSVWTTS